MGAPFGFRRAPALGSHQRGAVRTIIKAFRNTDGSQVTLKEKEWLHSTIFKECNDILTNN